MVVVVGMGYLEGERVVLWSCKGRGGGENGDLGFLELGM